MKKINFPSSRILYNSLIGSVIFAMLTFLIDSLIRGKEHDALHYVVGAVVFAAIFSALSFLKVKKEHHDR